MSGYEKSKHDWKEIYNMIYENLFTACPENIERIKEEINKILNEKTIKTPEARYDEA